MVKLPVAAVSINDNDQGVLPVQVFDQNGAVVPWSSRVALQPSSAQTATGNGAAMSVGQFKELLISLNVTAASGTSPSLSVFVDTSDDGGTTWYTHTYTIATGITGVNKATYVLGVAASGRAFGDTIRISWQISGTTPSFTFYVNAIGK